MPNSHIYVGLEECVEVRKRALEDLREDPPPGQFKKRNIFEVVVTLDKKNDKINTVKTAHYNNKHGNQLVQEQQEYEFQVERKKREEEKSRKRQEEEERKQLEEEEKKRREEAKIQVQVSDDKEIKVKNNNNKKKPEVVRNVVKAKKHNKINPVTGFDPRGVTNKIQEKPSPTKINEKLGFNLFNKAPLKQIPKIPKKVPPKDHSPPEATEVDSLGDEEVIIHDPLSDILGKMTAEASTSKEPVTEKEDVPRSPVKNCSRSRSLPRAQFIPEHNEELGVSLSIPDEGDEGIFDELDRLIQKNMSPQRSVQEKQDKRTSPPKNIETNVNGKEDKEEDEEEFEDNYYSDDAAGDASSGESNGEETTPEIGSDAPDALSSSLNNVHDDLDFDEDDDEEDEDDDGNFKRRSRQEETTKAITFLNDKKGNNKIDTLSAKTTTITQSKVISAKEPPKQLPAPVNVNVPAGRRLIVVDTEPEEDPEGKKAKRAARFASAPSTSGSIKITLNNNQNNNINNKSISNNSDNFPLPRPASRPATSVLLAKSTSSELIRPSREEESRPLLSSLSFSPSHDDVTEGIASEPMSFMHHSVLFDEHRSDLFSCPLKKPDPPAPVLLPLNPRDPRLSRSLFPPKTDVTSHLIRDPRLRPVPEPTILSLSSDHDDEKEEEETAAQNDSYFFDEDAFLTDTIPSAKDESPFHEHKVCRPFKRMESEKSFRCYRSRYEGTIEIPLEAVTGFVLKDPRVMHSNRPQIKRKPVVLILRKIFTVKPTVQEKKIKVTAKSNGKTDRVRANSAFNDSTVTMNDSMPSEELNVTFVAPSPVSIKPSSKRLLPKSNSLMLKKKGDNEEVTVKGPVVKNSSIKSMIDELIEGRKEYHANKKKKRNLTERIFLASENIYFEEEESDLSQTERKVSKDMKKIQIISQPNGVSDGPKQRVFIVKRKKRNQEVFNTTISESQMDQSIADELQFESLENHHQESPSNTNNDEGAETELQSTPEINESI